MIMLQAGFSRVDVTPHLGFRIDGNFDSRYAVGYLDPIELNAIALSDGECRVVMIAADLLGVDMKDVKVIKSLITERTGLDEEHIVISALHQHTSIMMYHQTEKRHPDSYVDYLYRKFADVAVMALNDLADAELYTGERETKERIAFVRRYFLNDGSVTTNPKPFEIDRVTGRCDESDNVVHLIRFKREGKRDIALINFSTHPAGTGGLYYSADYPGIARSLIEKRNPDTHCLFFTGAEGDSNRIDYLTPEDKRYPEGKGYGHTKYMGRLIADAVCEMWDDLTPHKDGKIFAAMTVIYNRSNTEGEEKYEECKKFYEDYFAGKIDYPVKGEWIAFARRVIHIREEMTIYRPLPITAVGISDVVIVGFAGEPFTDYEREVRRIADGRFALTFCLTNGYQGYLPTSKAFEVGGYEAANSHFTSTLEVDAINAAQKLLEDNFK